MRPRFIALGALCLLFVGVLVFFGTTPPARASSIITVTTTSDELNPVDGYCSLREAIAAVNSGTGSGGIGECPAGSAGDAILVPSGAYTLSQGELLITASLTLSGSGQINTIIDGNSQDRIFEITGTAVAVNMDGLTLRNGQGYYTSTIQFVGGILSSGVLTVTNSAISNMIGQGLYNNKGSVVVAGSVISNNTGNGLLNDQGSALITATTIANNSATGLANQNGANLVVYNSLFAGNYNANVQVGGGGIANIGGSLAVTGSTFVSNSAVGAGGGVFSYDGGDIQISNSTFANNSGGAFYNEGSGPPTTLVTVVNSIFSNNSSPYEGAAIRNEPNRLTVISSTFSGNSTTGSFGAGAIFNNGWGLTISDSTFYSNTSAAFVGAVGNSSGPMSITNSTFDGNTAAGDGGAILQGNGGTAALNNVTISGNVADDGGIGSGGGGGLLIEPGAVVTVSNTIIAGNLDLNGQAPDCSGTLTTGGHNLIESTTGCTLSGTAAGDITGTAALLGPLQDNGGPTWTQALLPGSPAIDAGSPATPGSGDDACEATDQRGVPRPQGLACDIGAYEAAPTVQLAGNSFSALQTAGTAPITVTLSQATPVTVTVQYSTTEGTAVAGHDYVAGSGTVTFTPGLTQTAFAIALLPDGPNEADESLTVSLATPSNAILGAANTATVTIHDDSPAPLVALGSSQYSITESGGSAIVTATLSAASELTATVHYATSNGTGLAGSDYVATSGTLTFTPGLTQTAFMVPITPDWLHEPDETFNVALSSPIGASLAAPYTATVTIHDDDPAPGVSFSSRAYTVIENGGAAVITVTLSAASGLTATVHYASSDGTATAGSDYTPVSGTLTFAPGQAQQAFTVPIVDDTQQAGPETVLLGLTNPAEAALVGPSSATLTIVEDEVEHCLYLPVVVR